MATRNNTNSCHVYALLVKNNWGLSYQCLIKDGTWYKAIIFILLFFILSLFSLNSWSGANAFMVVNGFDSQINGSINSIYKNLLLTSKGEIFFNNKKILLNKAESQNNQFSSYQNLHFWPDSFSPSKKLVFFIGDYKKGNSHLYIINLNQYFAYDLGEAAKYNDIYFLGWSKDEKTLFLSHSIGANNKGLIRIDTENMKLEVADDLSDFPMYPYLQKFLSYGETYIYTKYFEPSINKSTIKVSECKGPCQQEYIDFIAASDNFFIVLKKKKEEIERKKKNNNLNTTSNGQQ